MRTRDTTAESPPPKPPAARRGWAVFDLSATQLLATALAAVTATIAASYLGVSGTVIGAGVASVVSAIGNAVYGHSLRRTRERVRGRPLAIQDSDATHPAGARAPERAPVLPSPAPVRPSAAGRNPWRGIAIGSLSVFAAVLAVVTGVEMVAGRPLSDLVRGEAGTGTSVFGTGTGTSTSTGTSTGTGTGTPTGGTTPAPGPPTVTRTVTPSVVVTTPTVTPTAPAPTGTATPTVTESTTAAPPSSTAPAPSTADPTGTPSQLG
jgi:hypothetical protein